MSDTVISIENLGKSYLVGHRDAQRDRSAKFRELLAREMHSFVRKAGDVLRGRQIVEGDEIEEFWALQNVSFEVKRGEVVGIIGRNGAGKSTLLKILSRITEPTTGRAVLKGRVASLLEVGTGFHFELTGRENIFLNGAILGMSKKEIRRKFDEIVAFAEVERFLDTPVKRYSSGMAVRLAFAVAAHLDPEILIVDEVLAVGDAEFQKKCLGKMSEVAKGGRTVLFVSHNHAAVSGLCSHGVVLRGGHATQKLAVQAALEQYASERESALTTSWSRPQKQTKSLIYFESIAVRLGGQQPNHNLQCVASITVREGARKVIIVAEIRDSNSIAIIQAQPQTTPFIGGNVGTCTLQMSIDLPPLIPGTYRVDFWVGPHSTETADFIQEAVSFDIVDSPVPGSSDIRGSDHGFIVSHSSATATFASSNS
jgi:lipopolysaccharide transport system ATP-binding protein